MPRRLLRDAAILAAGVLAGGGGAWALERTVGAPRGTPVETLRPTGVGLPVLPRVEHTYAAGDLPAELRTYLSSGGYRRDVARVATGARRHLGRALTARRRCRRAAADAPRRCRSLLRGRPALVLDVDETSLSTVGALRAKGFTDYTAAVAPAVVAGTNPPVRPVVDLARFARRRDVSVFFVTGRAPAFRAATSRNLRRAGFRGWRGLYMKESGRDTVAFKSGARRGIERRGFRILANVGDQETDLAGGHAERAFKLPNPFYYVP